MQISLIGVVLCPCLLRLLWLRNSISQTSRHARNVRRLLTIKKSAASIPESNPWKPHGQRCAMREEKAAAPEPGWEQSGVCVHVAVEWTCAKRLSWWRAGTNHLCELDCRWLCKGGRLPYVHLRADGMETCFGCLKMHPYFAKLRILAPSD